MLETGQGLPIQVKQIHLAKGIAQPSAHSSQRLQLMPQIHLHIAAPELIPNALMLNLYKRNDPILMEHGLCDLPPERPHIHLALIIGILPGELLLGLHPPPLGKRRVDAFPGVVLGGAGRSHRVHREALARGPVGAGARAPVGCLACAQDVVRAQRLAWAQAQQGVAVGVVRQVQPGLAGEGKAGQAGEDGVWGSGPGGGLQAHFDKFSGLHIIHTSALKYQLEPVLPERLRLALHRHQEGVQCNPKSIVEHFRYDPTEQRRGQL